MLHRCCYRISSPSILGVSIVLQASIGWFAAVVAAATVFALILTHPHTTWYWYLILCMYMYMYSDSTLLLLVRCVAILSLLHIATLGSHCVLPVLLCCCSCCTVLYSYCYHLTSHAIHDLLDVCYLWYLTISVCLYFIT